MVATVCPALWEKTPSQHVVWMEEAERCSASPGFPGTPGRGSSPASGAFLPRSSWGVHMQASSPLAMPQLLGLVAATCISYQPRQCFVQPLHKNKNELKKIWAKERSS